MGSGFRAPEIPSKAAGPSELGQPNAGSPYEERRAGCQNGLRCFPQQRRGGAGVAPRGMFPVPLQTAAPRSWFGAMGETEPRG